jgi:hypothetical protein
MPGDENDVAIRNTKNESPIIETDDILALIPHIDRDWAMNVLNLMDYFHNTYGNEEGMMEYILGKLRVDQYDEEVVRERINQVRAAETQVLVRHGVIVI